MVSVSTKECQKPGCSHNSAETYNGKQGNTLKLCERHYYQLVSGESVTTDIDTSTDNWHRPLDVKLTNTTNTEKIKQYDEPIRDIKRQYQEWL